MLFVSTIIATIGRPSLARAVTSVLDQAFDRAGFEVIVVNDSGHPLAPEAWMQSPAVKVLATDRQERSVARNAGIAVARGEFVHILDDDDVMVPGALAALWALRCGRPEASWLYGSYASMDNDGRTLATFGPSLSGDIFAPLVAGESIPLQASLLRLAAVRGAGGFDPALTGVEDRDLSRQLAAGVSVAVAFTPAPVARIRVGQAGSTTPWAALPEQDRRSREKALRLPGSARRLKDASPSPSWRGRVVRAYIASARWNARAGQLRTAGRRLSTGAWLASHMVVRPAFWRGLRARIQ